MKLADKSIYTVNATKMIENLGLIIAVISLFFTIWWSFWIYTRTQKPKLNIYLTQMINSNLGKDSSMYFEYIENGKKKKRQLKKGEFREDALCIKLHNIGAIPITIDKFFFRSDKSSVKVLLEDCWVLVSEKDEHRMPLVLQSGSFWEGYVSRKWLQSKNQKNNNLIIVEGYDINNIIFTSHSIDISEKIYNDLWQKCLIESSY